jgi:NADPH-dependent ferric siderophore reductase
MTFARATVTATSALSARLRRIVLDVPDLARLGVPTAADAAVGIYFPADGQHTAPDMRCVDGVWEYHDEESAPEGRNYSVRFHDAMANRLTVDVVLHAKGPGSDWARRAALGDTVGLSHARSWYRPEPTAQWQLLVADLAGLPALARILSECSTQRNVLALVEVLDDTDLDYLPTAPNVTLVPAVGIGNGRSGSRLAELVARQPLPAGRGYCWFAGEATESRAVRKHIRGLGWAGEQFDIVGYWRHDSEAWDRRFADVADQVVAVYEQALADGKGEKAASEEFDEALERIGL